MDSANLDSTHGVTLVPDRKIALVTSSNLHKLSAYSYEDSNNLELLSSVADSTLITKRKKELGDVVAILERR